MTNDEMMMIQLREVSRDVMSKYELTDDILKQYFVPIIPENIKCLAAKWDWDDAEVGDKLHEWFTMINVALYNYRKYHLKQ